MHDDTYFLREAIRLAHEGMNNNLGGPFGAVVVKNGEIIGRGCNQVTSSSDPTAHAEVVAIRDACRNLNDFQLKDCTIYASCEPCPMCLGAIYWARPDRLVFAASHHDAADLAGFDDRFIYQEIALPPSERRIPTEQLLAEEGKSPFLAWRGKGNKTLY
jgi:guanine deaminase